MNENAMNNTSRTNWEQVDALTEDEIDTSDILVLTEEFLANHTGVHLSLRSMFWFKLIT